MKRSRSYLALFAVSGILCGLVLVLLGPRTVLNAQSLPPTMTICEDTRCDGGNGATSWSFTGQDGQEQAGGQIKKLLLERLDPGGVVIRRQDSPGAALGTGPYTIFLGHPYGDAANGTIIRHDASGHILETGVWKGVSSVTVCDAGLTAAQAKSIGARAAILKQNTDALNCDLIAARQGDPVAQTIAGLLLHDGMGVKHDQVAAFSWLKKAADANNYDGEIALAAMYQIGAGTPASDAKATALLNKAQQQKAAADAAAAKRDVLELIAVSAFATVLMAEAASASTGNGGSGRSASPRNGPTEWDAQQHNYMQQRIKSDPGYAPPHSYDANNSRSH